MPDPSSPERTGLVKSHSTPSDQWVRQRNGKLIAPTDPDEAPELYHLAQDPMEHPNLARSHPDRVEALRAALIEWTYAAAAPSTNRPAAG